MNVTETKLPGVLLIEPKVFGDERGFFMEAFNAKRYSELGIPGSFVQDNLSYSAHGVLRGLHFQNPNAQGKLVSVLEGEVYDVAVDIRVGSPNFGEWTGATLSADNKRQLWVPAGFAHGFVVTSEFALFSYKCDAYYSPDSEHAILWNDGDIGVEWPTASPTLSGKDQNASPLSETPQSVLPVLS